MKPILFIFNFKVLDIMKKIKRIISCAITICLTIGILTYLTDLMERKSSDQKYEDFWKQEEGFDVLFFGTSHMINGVFPMKLWDDYGIVSYNFGGHSNQIATTYWVMENALDKTKPQVVVIDCLEVENQRKCSDIFSYVHLSLDTFPLSCNKIKAIWDLLDDPVLEQDIADGKARTSAEPRTKIGLLWDYSVYHSRWNEINQNDFEPASTYEKGAESRIGVRSTQLNRINKDEKILPGSTGDIYLRRMIEDCQDRGIEVVLTYLPFSAAPVQQMTANYIYDIAEEYNVGYINFLDTDIVNYQTDMYDGEHLTPSGARKVTSYIGKYLFDNYNVCDHSVDGKYEFWNKDYTEYTNFVNNNINNCSSINEYLMLLAGDDLEIRMDIRNKDIFKNQLIMNLLENIGVDTNQLSCKTDFIIIKDYGQKIYVIDNIRNAEPTQMTELGNASLRYDLDGEEGEYGLYIEDEQVMLGNSLDNTAIQIDVYRNDTKIDSVRFASSTLDDITEEIKLTAVR